MMSDRQTKEGPYRHEREVASARNHARAAVALRDNPLMGAPKLHHFVPQFYLRRFADENGKLWVWDRDADRVFTTGTNTVAAETNFYFHEELLWHGHDPLIMEKQLSSLEGDAAAITDRWVRHVRASPTGSAVNIDDEERTTISLFLAVQVLRTADTRDTLAALDATDAGAEPSASRLRALHLELMWDDGIVDRLAARLHSSSWIFAKNTSETPLVTSDNPVAFRTEDHRIWLKVPMLDDSTFMAYALAPDVVMYAYPHAGRWARGDLGRFDATVSPVLLTSAMVRGENTAHVFLASRHVVSCEPDFDWAREFAKAVRTGKYAPNPPDGTTDLSTASARE